jgi:hypothetical protein
MALPVRAIAEPPSKLAPGHGLNGAGPAVARDIEVKLKYQLGLQPGQTASARDAYQAAAWSVRERLIDAFDKTHAHWK